MHWEPRAASAVILVFFALTLVAWTSPRPTPQPLGKDRPLDCELTQELRPKNEPTSWCPTFGHVYICKDRVLVVTQAVDKEDPQVCIRIQVAQLTIGQGV